MNGHSLYLQGGPGLGTGVERAWFADELPILWWEQPACTGSWAFDDLVQACERKTTELAATSGTSVHLCAWSFGGQVAAALARRIPTEIASITLLGCSPDMGRAFRQLAVRLAADNTSDQGLLTAIRDDASEGGQDRLMALVAACSPYLPAAWFGPRSEKALAKFGSLASRLQFDATTFRAVLTDFLGREPSQAPSPFQGPVRLWLGTFDRFAKPSEDEAAWRRHFPQLQAHLLECGHAVQFEIDSGVWWTPSA